MLDPIQIKPSRLDQHAAWICHGDHDYACAACEIIRLRKALDEWEAWAAALRLRSPLALRRNKGDRMRYEPLYERVICRRIDPETTAAGGLLHIPEQAQEKPQEGEVLYVGCGRLLEDGRVIPLLVKPGDRVLFGKYAGTEIEINGEKVVILREDELLARQTSED